MAAIKFSAPKPGEIRDVVALTVSWTVHVAIALSVGLYKDPVYRPRANVQGASMPIQINLIKSSSTEAAIAATLAEPKVDKEEVRLPPILPLPQPEPNIPPPVLPIRTSAPYYFQTSELAEKPRVIADVSPKLARQLRNETPQSTIVRLLINESGSIDQVLIDESGLSESGQTLLRNAFLKMRFEPGKIDQAPVKTEMKIEIMLEKVRAKSTLLEQIAPNP